MKQKENRLHRAPDVDVRNLHKRMLLEAQLFTLDVQVRNFGPIRDRLAAAGEDGTAHYRKIQARRDKVSKALKKLGSGAPPLLADQSGSIFQRPNDLVATVPITPARFLPDLGVFGFGTSGVVQMAAASEGVNDIVRGKHPSSGEITTLSGAYPGSVHYSGQIEVGPETIPENQFNMDIDYFWVHNWKYLVPFPPPTVESRLTYNFDVYARTSVFFEGGAAIAMAFVSVGETGNLTTGIDIVPNVDGGWPLMADLTQPGPSYNGHYGNVDGSVTVQRSFMVPGGRVPAIAIVVGAIGALSMMTKLRLFFSENSAISVGSQNMTGRLSYSYEPQLSNHP